MGRQDLLHVRVYRISRTQSYWIVKLMSYLPWVYGVGALASDVAYVIQLIGYAFDVADVSSVYLVL